MVDHNMQITVDLFTTSMMAAVSLNIMDLKETTKKLSDVEGGEKQLDNLIRDWTKYAGSMLAHHGDKLLFRTVDRPGTACVDYCATNISPHYRCDCTTRTATVFNAVARGVAALSTCPGGVRLMGTLYCATHYPVGVRADGHQWCLKCTNEETHNMSVLEEMYWDSLMDILIRLWQTKYDQMEPIDIGEMFRDEGRAESAATCIAIIENPHNPNVESVRQEAHRRLKVRLGYA